MQRSGTTLLEKLLCNHPRLSVLSQPFPFFYVEGKRSFLQSLGHDDPFPLGTGFDEGRYEAADLERFLAGFRPGKAMLRAWFAAMEGYSGVKTQHDPAQLTAAIDAAAEAPFFEAAAILYRRLAHRPEAELYGGKEIQCEELIGPMLAVGWKVLAIIRDPRDVIASLNTGRGQDWGGTVKPTLFNIHNWRKSVAHCLRAENAGGFAWIRYEDLVADPIVALGPAFRALGVSPFGPDQLAGGIRDQSGRLWSGNSSHSEFDSVSTGSVGGYQGRLPPPVIRLIEATCYAELRLLGYPVSLQRCDSAAAIREFREPWSIERDHLRDYGHDGDYLAAELRRVELLESAPIAESRRYFLFPEVHERLRRAV